MRPGYRDRRSRGADRVEYVVIGLGLSPSAVQPELGVDLWPGATYTNVNPSTENRRCTQEELNPCSSVRGYDTD